MLLVDVYWPVDHHEIGTCRPNFGDIFRLTKNMVVVWSRKGLALWRSDIIPSDHQPA